MRRLSPLLAIAACSLFPLSGHAQTFGGGGLDPEIGQPLTVMSNMAGQQCQMGNQQGCMTLQQIQQGAAMLMQAQAGCQQGNAQACQMYQMGAQQVMTLYGQVQAANGGGMMPGPVTRGGFSNGPMPPPLPQGGYDPAQTQFYQQQQNIQAQQNQFDQQNQQWRQNQLLNDQRNQQFIDTLRQ